MQRWKKNQNREIHNERCTKKIYMNVKAFDEKLFVLLSVSIFGGGGVEDDNIGELELGEKKWG